MRVRVIFGLNNRGGWVPFHHQFLIADFLENLIRKEMPDYADYSEFNFSGIKGQTKVGKHGLHFYSNKITLVISAWDKEFMDALLKAIFSMKFMDVGKLNISPESVEMEEIPDFKESAKFICISPLVITNVETEIGLTKQFVDPEEDLFSDLLYESTMLRLEESKRFSDEQMQSFYKFQVEPDQRYLAKIKATEKKFSRIYPAFDGDKKIEVRGYTLPFTFYVDELVQKYVFITGFGEYANKGFGMLDLANVDPTTRSKAYEF